MLKEAYRLMGSTPTDRHPSSILTDFEPLTRGQYPVFNKYPTFIVEYQSQERERIHQQELEYLRERWEWRLRWDYERVMQKDALWEHMCMFVRRQTLQELRAEAVRQQAEDEAWYTQQELLQQAEEQRRRVLQEEESKLTQQRARYSS